jgi:hypothetical protein
MNRVIFLIPQIGGLALNCKVNQIIPTPAGFGRLGFASQFFIQKTTFSEAQLGQQ